MAPAVTTSRTSAATAGLPGRYAAALYELAAERMNLDEVLPQAEALARLIDESPELRVVLKDVRLDIREQQAAMSAVLQAQGMSKLISDFVGVVIRNRRLSDLRQILAAVAAIAAKKRGEVEAEVISAQPLSVAQRAGVQGKLAEAGYSSVHIVEKVDPSILGGLVVRVGPWLFDNSLQSRLVRLHYAMKGAA
ncbi:MAG: ATP synthase F1 subunit delta [Acetobacter sp.]|nr:ATP synthase F1 subunit delta [Acetobacter sp.]MCH4060317.1 ATP synthase F1 subunit delta [Acetobacter sp.]MCH4087257.1 ATP synthase F1 subunit delta [Acetobacter sp.]MCI1293078.1 ATP synthase F1 subunit delta [Acetobacter sp.]MCI1319664.1 ATP synthase F1 subunit delta [Acetobacter sp.]